MTSRATSLAIAAPNRAAAEAGEAIAAAGGSAVDAALAAALVAMVNEVGIVSLSSGGFLTVQPAAGAAYTVDGWMDVPGRDRSPTATTVPTSSSAPTAVPRTWDIHTAYGGGVDITIGPGSVATHGSLAAFGEVHRRDGRLPWREVVAPAIDVARGGFALGGASRYYLDYVHESVFGWDDASRAAVHGQGGPDGPDGPGAGVTTDPIVLPDLVASLEHIAAHGPRSMHEGDLAAAITDDVLDRGGLLGPADLAAYAPVVRAPLQARMGGWQLSTVPAPSVGGVCVAAMLRLLDTAEVPTRERMIEVQRAVLGHRLDVFDTSDDLSADAAAYLALIDRDHLGVLESGSTAHVSVVDTDGTACAVTVSSGYGAGMIARGTGIWLNNCLGEQELNPRGLFGTPPGTRLLSNMAPTVGRHPDGSTLAVGSPGADRITTAIVQVLAGVVGGLDLTEAVHRPRVHVHRAGRAGEEVKTETEPTMYYGGVGVARVDPEGLLSAAADPRREGEARIVRPGS